MNFSLYSSGVQWSRNLFRPFLFTSFHALQICSWGYSIQCFSADPVIVCLDVWGLLLDCCQAFPEMVDGLSHRCVWLAQGHPWQWCLTPALSRLCLGSLSCWNMNIQPNLSSKSFGSGYPGFVCSFFPNSDHYLSQPQKHTRTPWCCSHNASLYGRASHEQVISSTALQIEFLDFRSRRSIMVFADGSGIQYNPVSESPAGSSCIGVCLSESCPKTWIYHSWTDKTPQRW